MLDKKLRTLKDVVFEPLARMLQVIPPWYFSVVGLFLGILAAVALWQQLPVWGMILWLINRIFDGLDGAVARIADTQSDFGGYLDILADYIVYAAVPVGLAWGYPGDGVLLALVFLLSTFYVNSASWMYLAALMEKRRLAKNKRLTSINMPAGLIGGTETIMFFALFIIFPQGIVWMFTLMGMMIAITVGQRIAWAYRHLQ